MRAVNETPLLDTKSAAFGTGVPSRILVYENEIEVRTLRPPRRSVQRVRYEQIAQVFVNRGIVYAELVIETRGGGTLSLAGMSKPNAEAARALIRERLDAASTGAAGVSYSGAPEQIRKLAELRDAGILSAEEFETKKKDLLDRM